MRARLPLVLAMVGLLLVVVVSARGTSAIEAGPTTLFRGTLPTLPNSTNDQDQRFGAVVSTVSGIGVAGLILICGAAMLFGFAIVLAGLVGSRRRKLGLPDPVIRSEDEDRGTDTASVSARLAGGVRAAQAALRQRFAGPPSDAVVAAWLALETAAADVGVPRLPAQTPTEFTSAVLATYTDRDDALDQLRALYQRARFGLDHEIAQADAEAAADALDRVLERLDPRAVAR